MNILSTITDSQDVNISVRNWVGSTSQRNIYFDLKNDHSDVEEVTDQIAVLTDFPYYSTFSYSFSNLKENEYYTLTLREAENVSEIYTGKVFVTDQPFESYEVNVNNTDYIENQTNNDFIIY